jgi:hypothetical protein
MIGASIRFWAASVLAVGLAGCSLHDRLTTTSAPGPGSTAPASSAAPGAMAQSPAITPRPQPVGPEAPGGARSVAYRFAVAYANVSATRTATRARTLLSLAAPAYRAALRRDVARAQVAAVRALPPGAQIVARITSLQLARPSAHADRGVVIFATALRHADGRTEQPFTSIYVFELSRAVGGWRVASFRPVP